MLNFPLSITLERRPLSSCSIVHSFREDGRSLSKNEYTIYGEMPLLPSTSVGYAHVLTTV